MKKLGSISSFDVITKDSGNFYLIYADDTAGSKKNLCTIDLKTVQERNDLSFSITSEQPDDQKSIAQVN